MLLHRCATVGHHCLDLAARAFGVELERRGRPGPRGISRGSTPIGTRFSATVRLISSDIPTCIPIARRDTADRGRCAYSAGGGCSQPEHDDMADAPGALHV